jgi:hypothetical protein
MRDQRTADATDRLVPTANLLWESCRRSVDRDAVRRTLDAGADPALAVEAATEHRIGPLLWRALDDAGAQDRLGADEPVLRGMADAFKMEALLLLPRAVATAIQPLTANGLEPVVIKGPAVASRYPAPGLRPMEDIDVLLPAVDHPRALGALQSAGWEIRRPSGSDLYDTALVHPDVPSLSLELHYGLEAPSQRVTALDVPALWERRRPIECAGTRAFGLPLDDELVVLAAHAGKPHHGFVRLVWIADFAMFVSDATTRGEPVDWDRVRRRAQANGCTTVVAGRSRISSCPATASMSP